MNTEETVLVLVLDVGGLEGGSGGRAASPRVSVSFSERKLDGLDHQRPARLALLQDGTTAANRKGSQEGAQSERHERRSKIRVHWDSFGSLDGRCQHVRFER